MNTLKSFLAVALSVGAVAVSADVFRLLGQLATRLPEGGLLSAFLVEIGSAYTEQYLAALVAIALPLLFLQVRANGDRDADTAVPWFDRVAALVGFLSASYVAVRFPVLSELVSRRPTDGLIVAGLLLVLFLEGLRRTTGTSLFYTSIAFMVLALFGASLPGELAARSIPADRLAYYLVWDSTATLGITMKIVATVVVVYVLFGQILFKAGGSAFFTGIAMALMGRYRGGPAKIAIVGSSLFGSISGNIVSNVMTVGTVTIPLMVRAGFKPHLAAAIEACASTAGQITPPVMGIAAFIMAEFLQVPFYAVALAATIPALLFYTALFVQVDLEAARSDIQRMPESEIPRLGEVFRRGWFFILPFAVLVYVLFWQSWEPEAAGLLAIVTTLVLALAFPFEGKRITWRDLVGMFRETGVSVLDLFMIGAASGIMIGALNYSGVGFTLTIVLLQVAGGSLIALLILSAIVNIILGLGLPTVGVYILLATLVAPALVKMGIEPMAAHMFIMYYGSLSMISPPVAIAAFAAANLAGADHNKAGWAAMAFGWTIFVIPFLFVFSPTLLANGDPVSIAIDFAAAVIGIWFISASIMGYSVRALSLAGRIGYGLAGILVFLPAVVAGPLRWVNLVGVALALALFVRDRAIAGRPLGFSTRRT